MQNTDYNLENEAQKILWDFEMEADHVIPARSPDLQS